MQRYEQNALLMVILMKSTFITHTQTYLIYKNIIHTKYSVQNLVKLVTYSRVAYIYVRSRAKYLKFRTTTSKFNTLRKPLMQQKYYFTHEM